MVEKTSMQQIRDHLSGSVKPEIVCLCGSTRFMDVFHAVGWQLTLEGKIVLGVAVCKHAQDHGGEALSEDVCEMLDELHLRKIDLADTVMILNVGGYIGDSTRAEMLYAQKKGKRLVFSHGPLDGPPDPRAFRK